MLQEICMAAGVGGLWITCRYIGDVAGQPTVFRFLYFRKTIQLNIYKVKGIVI